ncbi:MAG: glycosyltransferase family 2 protein [Tepidisphaeraceae bacterium]|jgi:glycosyltransferase involved in cell wall biosynthesis
MSTPLRISVALCTCNGAKHLPEQLQSLSGQTRQPDELIVYDDASDDGSAEIVRRFAESAPFPIRLNVNPRNLGATENFQQAIAACGGDVIALCDQDDVWMSRKLHFVEAEFVRDRNLGFVFTDAEICGETGSPLGYTLWQSVRFTPRLQRRVNAGRVFEVILRNNIVTGATMAFASRFKSLVLPIDPLWFHDGWIALLISAFAPVRIIRQSLIRYRQHPAQSVGALQRTFYQQYLAAKKMDRHVFADHSRMYQAAQARLESWHEQPLRDGNVLPALEGKIRHCRIRSAIRLRQRNRLATSIVELLTLRYRRYSLGWKSFAQDLFL